MMEFILTEVAERIRGLRDMMDITPEEMAEVTGVPLEEYLACENGEKDFSFTFLYKCAVRFGVDMTELLTGETAKLSGYSLIRKNEGLPMKRRAGFEYQNLAYLFRDRMAEPFLVTAPYFDEEQTRPIALSSHNGQEFDFILSGSLKFCHDGHIETLSPGDAVYYNSQRPHGMIAVGGEPCTFLAMVMKTDEAK